MIAWMAGPSTDGSYVVAVLMTPSASRAAAATRDGSEKSPLTAWIPASLSRPADSSLRANPLRQCVQRHEGGPQLRSRYIP
jgi:hypothetical protein